MDERDLVIRRAATLSLVVSVLLLLIKVGAAVLTGSLAIWSDAAESIVHLASIGFMWYAVRLAQRPADAEHPYGHGKVEAFSVGFEGGLVFLAGIGIVFSVVDGWAAAHELGRLGFGLVLLVAAAVINSALGWYLVRLGRRHQTEVLVADGQHILSDAYTSWAVALGVLVVWFLDESWHWLDSAVAVLVAVHLLWTGFRLVRSAGARLMDAADPQLVARVVEAINSAREPQWYDVHCLRVHVVGHQRHVDFHLKVPEDWTVAEGHAAMDTLEDLILGHLGTPGTVLVHLDPVERRDESKELSPVTVGQACRPAVDADEVAFS